MVAHARFEMKWPDWVWRGHGGIESHRGVDTYDEIVNVMKDLEDLSLACGRDGVVRGLKTRRANSAWGRGRGLRNRVDLGSEYP